MSGFVKIYGSKLITSSLWDEDPCARLVFLSLLAIADADGVIDVPNTRALARVLNLEIGYVEAALAILEAPDSGSRTKADDGRRVVREESQWRLVNYAKYREYRTPTQEAARQRVAEYRAKRTSSAPAVTCNASNDPVTEVRADAEAEAEAESVCVSLSSLKVPDSDACAHVEPLPVGSGSAYDWQTYFGRQWCEKYSRVSYGHSGDAKACGSLDELLRRMGPGEAAKAWAERERIVGDYLASDEPTLARIAFVFCFFVPRFTALTMGTPQPFGKRDRTEEAKAYFFQTLRGE